MQGAQRPRCLRPALFSLVLRRMERQRIRTRTPAYNRTAGNGRTKICAGCQSPTLEIQLQSKLNPARVRPAQRAADSTSSWCINLRIGNGEHNLVEDIEEIASELQSHSFTN